MFVYSQTKDYLDWQRLKKSIAIINIDDVVVDDKRQQQRRWRRWRRMTDAWTMKFDNELSQNMIPQSLSEKQMLVKLYLAYLAVLKSKQRVSRP